MHYNSEKHHRRSIRLKGYDYSQVGLYFVSLCSIHQAHLVGKIVNGKTPLLPIGEISNVLWSEIPNHFSNVHLHEFVVMPNHVHGIIEITNHCNIMPPLHWQHL